MTKINLLDDLTANQIAAGEVVERPVSVIKELIENSLDAGANSIGIAIREGGLKSILVQDDGSGMSKEDALLAVKRHATSKLKVIDDLQVLRTLGFRGEALPSIVSVAKVELVTKTAESDSGLKLMLEGSTLISAEPAGTPVGTIVTVNDLFYNTPARRKFMRSPAYEAGLIHELLINFSLSHPQVNFRLSNEGREILNTAGVSSVPDLLELFYGSKAKAALVKLEGKLHDGTVSGYLTLPTFHRVNRKGIYFFVNSRKVIAKELTYALTEAYARKMPKGRFPLSVVYLNLDPALIDVNVHPSKLEIRFRDLSTVRELAQLFRTILEEQKTAPIYQLTKPLLSLNFPASDSVDPDNLNPSSLSLESSNLESPGPKGPGADNFSSAGPPSASSLPVKWPGLPEAPHTAAFVQESWESFALNTNLTNDAPLDTVAVLPEKKGIKAPEITPGLDHRPVNGLGNETVLKPDREVLPELRIIGQLAATFILAEAASGLYMIDQHVAHERVIFERLKQQTQSGALESQLLLHPIPLQLTALEEEQVIEQIMTLSELGIVLEHFGPRSYLLRAVPSSLGDDSEDFFYALLQRLTHTNKKISLPDLKEEYLIMVSCKSAIKANQVLTVAEMNSLLQDLRAANNSLTCPHGRPIIYHIPYKDILKAFRRS